MGRSIRVLGLALSCMSLLALGASVASATDYCHQEVDGCLVLEDQRTAICCVDPDGNGVRNTATCWQELYACWLEESATYDWGPAFGCSSPGPECQ